MIITLQRAYELRALIEKASTSLSDVDALKGIELFPLWKVNTAYSIDERIRYNTRLYKVRQAHTSQSNWTPDITPALYAEVEEPGQGDTPDNPISYNGNMELFKDKYYSQDGVVYICTRDTGAPVYNPLSALVGLYVEVYTGGN